MLTSINDNLLMQLVPINYVYHTQLI
jgi:hypothetical protein